MASLTTNAARFSPNDGFFAFGAANFNNDVISDFALGDGNSLTLNGITPGQLTADSFVFL